MPTLFFTLSLSFFEGFKPQNVIFFLFPMKHSYLLLMKITPNYPPIFTCYAKGLGNSLYVRLNFWCLIMFSTKLIEYEYARSFFK